MVDIKHIPYAWSESQNPYMITAYLNDDVLEMYEHIRYNCTAPDNKRLLDDNIGDMYSLITAMSGNQRLAEVKTMIKSCESIIHHMRQAMVGLVNNGNGHNGTICGVYAMYRPTGVLHASVIICVGDEVQTLIGKVEERFNVSTVASDGTPRGEFYIFGWFDKKQYDKMLALDELQHI